jgi:ATP-dependent DNA helicase HFM1/MER3
LTTPEKFDAVTRRAQNGMSFLSDVALFCVDEVHILNDERGPALEAVVSRLKLLSRLPSLAGTPLSRLRFVAVSATIPNVGSVGQWLGAPNGFSPSFGDEYRACALEVKVHGYNAAKSDFLFERYAPACLRVRSGFAHVLTQKDKPACSNLKNYLYPVLLQYADGRPSLVFCASRREAEDSAAKVVEGIPRGAGYQGGPPHPFVRSAAAAAALAAAASSVESPRLAACLPAGVGFHSAALSQADRCAVEALFRAGTLLVLCTTSTLAQGVNLPARLVVIKGTKQCKCPEMDIAARLRVLTQAPYSLRYSADDKGGYRDYPRSAVLQMIGRAGRPQFDERGCAVIMTERSCVASYTALAGGGDPVESKLAGALAEHLCAEVVAGTVGDISQAVAWLKASFLWTRMAVAPAAYGLPPGAPPAALERECKAMLLRTCAALADAAAVRVDDDGFGLAPLPAGEQLTRYYVRFSTLRAAQAEPRHAALPDVLLLLVSAEEFSWVKLRRDEKALCKALNATVRYPLLDAQGKAVKVFTTGAQKLFLLVQDALSSSPSDAVNKTHSLRAEVDDFFRNGGRVARCIAETYLAGGRLAGAAHAAALARAAHMRLWDASGAACRQFDGVGRVLGAQLAAAGIATLDDLDGADPRRLEAAAGRNYPFGDTLKAAAARAPRVELAVTPVGGAVVPQAGDAVEFVVRVRATAAAGKRSGVPALLLCGTRQDDALLHWQRISIAAADDGWSMTARFAVTVPADGPMQVVAGIIFDDVVGRDVTAHWSWTPIGYVAPGSARRGPLPLTKKVAGKRAAPDAGALSFVAAKSAALGPTHEILAAAPPRAKRVARPPLLPDSDHESDSDQTLPVALPPRAAPPLVARMPSPERAVCMLAPQPPQPPPTERCEPTPCSADYDRLFEGLF